MRPTWKGNITFGLVSIPVLLYPAEKETTKSHFKLVDSKDKSKIKYVRINEQTGKEVPWERVAKAYEYDKNDFVIIKPEELKEISPEKTQTINIENFVQKEDLDYIDFEKPYYLVPDKKCEKGYVILREVLNKTGTVGIAKVVIHTREYLVALMPYEKGLVLDILRYHDDLKSIDDFELPSDDLKKYKITAKELDIAKQLVKSMEVKWNPDDYHDQYEEALHKWVEDKARHHKRHPTQTATKAPAGRGQVIDFADLLQKSLKSIKPKSKQAARHPAKKIKHHAKTGTTHRK